MPLPHAVARFNKRVTNRFVEPIVRRTRGFVAVHHVGRRSGTAYTTPLHAFDLDGDALVVLTYGRRADWLQNALAGEAALEGDAGTRRIRSIAVVGRDVAWPALPWFVRTALRVLGVRDFARLTTVDERR